MKVKFYFATRLAFYLKRIPLFMFFLLLVSVGIGLKPLGAQSVSFYGGTGGESAEFLAFDNSNGNQSQSVIKSGQGKSTPSLKVEVSHSDYLPSLPPQLHPGNYFGGWSNTQPESNMGRSGTTGYVIPRWLAGKWMRAQSTETKRVQLPEGKPLKTTGTTMAKSEDVFGTYQDAEGRIWQVFDPRKSTGVVDRGEVIDHHRVMKYKIEVLDPNTVVVEVTASHLAVSQDKRQIVNSFQDEELNTYTLLGKGRAKTESSVKVFDQLGKPVLLTNSVSYVTKIESLD